MRISNREIIDFVARLPDDCTIVDTIDPLRLLEKVERGIEDADNGKLIDHELVAPGA